MSLKRSRSTKIDTSNQITERPSSVQLKSLTPDLTTSESGENEVKGVVIGLTLRKILKKHWLPLQKFSFNLLRCLYVDCKRPPRPIKHNLAPHEKSSSLNLKPRGKPLYRSLSESKITPMNSSQAITISSERYLRESLEKLHYLFIRKRLKQLIKGCQIRKIGWDKFCSKIETIGRNRRGLVLRLLRKADLVENFKRKNADRYVKIQEIFEKQRKYKLCEALV